MVGKFFTQKIHRIWGGGELSGEREAEINERSPSQDCETSGFEYRRHRKSSITFRNNSGLAVTSFSF